MVRAILIAWRRNGIALGLFLAVAVVGFASSYLAQS
jgi:hypothetical protein